MGNMIRAAVGDFGKNMFSPAALLTGGASLAFTGAKAMKKANEPVPQAPVVPQSGSQPGTAPQRPGVGGGGMAPGAMGASAGTLLTGPGGVDPTRLALGKSTLLGQ